MRSVFLLALILTLTAYPPHSPAYIEKMSAVMTSQQVQGGKSVTVKGQLFYQQNGNLVTRFTFPKEFLVISNKVGEVKVYDPQKNSVLAYQNFVFSTQSTQFYYFFSGKSSDMGLTDIGYVPEKTYNEGDLAVTIWKQKVPDKKSQVHRVKLVFQNQQPVYMHYEDARGKVFRKVYYYKYLQLENTRFPSVTTEIVYSELAKDSTVTRTTYSDFRLNHLADNSYMNYKIPANAKIEK